ncbi:MAG TPA: DUF2937 family protein [Turneriella sp.]|nr:DUF2937 family protein [Turneriella sp.]HNA79179.1 DUF2937 family protein [Turneriella sp.]HNE20928.1 DUF2937 family protein [Turneriella sp.]HNJ67078.1 DUF2937 family protein [Turneriella sp.]HNL10904.1 DUF2937 family protein [Turneriella sp.]
MGSITRYIGSFFGSLAERLVVFFVALFLSQAPQYMNLYLNVLSGAKAAHEKSVATLTEKAQELDMTVQQFIDDLLKADSKVSKSSGQVHQKQLADFENTKRAFEALKNATAFSRPFVFIKHVDWSLAKNVQFQPAFPLTLEALMYVLVGIILGMILYRALMFFPRRLLGNKSAPAY